MSETDYEPDVCITCGRRMEIVARDVAWCTRCGSLNRMHMHIEPQIVGTCTAVHDLVTQSKDVIKDVIAALLSPYRSWRCRRDI